MKAESLLKSRFKDKNSLIINAAHAGSAYQTDTLRAELARLFGPLVALALPEAIGADTDSFLKWLIVLQTELQQFMIAAEETRNRVQTHAR